MKKTLAILIAITLLVTGCMATNEPTNSLEQPISTNQVIENTTNSTGTETPQNLPQSLTDEADVNEVETEVEDEPLPEIRFLVGLNFSVDTLFLDVLTYVDKPLTKHLPITEIHIQWTPPGETEPVDIVGDIGHIPAGVTVFPFHTEIASFRDLELVDIDIMPTTLSFEGGLEVISETSTMNADVYVIRNNIPNFHNMEMNPISIMQETTLELTNPEKVNISVPIHNSLEKADGSTNQVDLGDFQIEFPRLGQGDYINHNVQSDVGNYVLTSVAVDYVLGETETDPYLYYPFETPIEYLQTTIDDFGAYISSCYGVGISESGEIVGGHIFNLGSSPSWVDENQPLQITIIDGGNETIRTSQKITEYVVGCPVCFGVLE
jgi:hypothetical protein